VDRHLCVDVGGVNDVHKGGAVGKETSRSPVVVLEAKDQGETDGTNAGLV